MIPETPAPHPPAPQGAADGHAAPCPAIDHEAEERAWQRAKVRISIEKEAVHEVGETDDRGPSGPALDILPARVLIEPIPPDGGRTNLARGAGAAPDNQPEKEMAPAAPTAEAIGEKEERPLLPPKVDPRAMFVKPPELEGLMAVVHFRGESRVIRLEPEIPVAERLRVTR